MDFTNLAIYENIAIVVLVAGLYYSCKGIVYLWNENKELSRIHRDELRNNRAENASEMKELWSYVHKQSKTNNELLREITESSRRNGN